MIEIIRKFTKYENLSVSMNEFLNIKIFSLIIKEIDLKEYFIGKRGRILETFPSNSRMKKIKNM
jgi:hypothetical protein